MTQVRRTAHLSFPEKPTWSSLALLASFGATQPPEHQSEDPSTPHPPTSSQCPSQQGHHERHTNFTKKSTTLIDMGEKAHRPTAGASPLLSSSWEKISKHRAQGTTWDTSHPTSAFSFSIEGNIPRLRIHKTQPRKRPPLPGLCLVPPASPRQLCRPLPCSCAFPAARARG